MNPSTGRFVSMDSYSGSIYDPVSLHKYLYANGNPVMYCDPTGYNATLLDLNMTLGIMAILSAIVVYNCNFNGGTIAKLLPESTYQNSEDIKIPIISNPILLPLHITGIIFNEIKSNNEIESDTHNEEDKDIDSDIPDEETTNKTPDETKFPKNPDDLLKDGWKDVTPDGMKENTNSREFEKTGTDEKIRFDKGKPGESGFEGVDHYHRYNPKSTGKGDYYLDKYGNPVPKNSKPSHILTE